MRLPGDQLKAGEVELEIARRVGYYEHIQDRLKAVKDWTEDPLVPPRLRSKYEELCIKTKRIVAARKEAER